MPDPKDVFHIIGFTREAILEGALHRSMDMSMENLKLMGQLHARFGGLTDAARQGLVVQRQVEVYFIDSFVADRNGEFAELFEKYQLIDFYNDAALDLSNRFGIQLPPVIGQTTREKLPTGLGLSMQFISFLPA